MSRYVLNETSYFGAGCRTEPIKREVYQSNFKI